MSDAMAKMQTVSNEGQYDAQGQHLGLSRMPRKTSTESPIDIGVIMTHFGLQKIELGQYGHETDHPNHSEAAFDCCCAACVDRVSTEDQLLCVCQKSSSGQGISHQTDT